MTGTKSESVNQLQKKLKSIVEAESDHTFSTTPHSESMDVISTDERIKAIKAKGLEQDIELKRNTLEKLFKFLVAETIVIFSFALLQATNWLGFELEEWSFKLLVAATLVQITYMIQVAVKHLFPDKKEN